MTVEPAAFDVFPFRNSYARLPDRFFERLAPTPVAAPRLIKLNLGLALDLGLDPEALATPEGVEVLAGNRVPEKSEPMYSIVERGFSGFAPLGFGFDARPFPLAT